MPETAIRNIYGETLCLLSELPETGCHHCVSGEPNLGYYGGVRKREGLLDDDG